MKREELKVGMRVVGRGGGPGTVVGEPLKRGRKWAVRRDKTGRVVRVIPEKLRPEIVGGHGDGHGRRAGEDNDLPGNTYPNPPAPEGWAEGSEFSPEEEVSHDTNGSA